MEIEIIERLTRIEDKVKGIEEHTKVMNGELGECQESLKGCNEEIANMKKNIVFRISWKDAGKIAGLSGTIVTIIYTLLKIFVFRSP